MYTVFKSQIMQKNLFVGYFQLLSKDQILQILDQYYDNWFIPKIFLYLNVLSATVNVV